MMLCVIVPTYYYYIIIRISCIYVKQQFSLVNYLEQKIAILYEYEYFILCNSHLKINNPSLCDKMLTFLHKNIKLVENRHRPLNNVTLKCLSHRK